VTRLSGQRTLWVHAVSVGEVRSAAPLVSALVERYPKHRIVVTTMTPTGSRQVRELFGDRVSHCYVPFDFPDAVRRFLGRVRPEAAVIAETEFWPNIFAECGRRRIPLLLVNGRVSQASLRGYLRVPNIARAMLANADLLCAQTRVDAQRLRNLGASEHLIHVTGNLKFDVEVPARLLEEARALRGHWGLMRPVWIAASTHAGEERKILEAYALLKRRLSTLLLVLVPRHPERFHAVASLSRRRGFGVALRSRTPGALPAGTDVLVGDTMGELQRLYAAADVAFIGGSLVPHGGQNLLEACAVEVPVVFGPHMFHFEEISAMALERGAARQVHDVQGLAEAVALYFDQPDLRRAAGSAAHTLVTDNRGALERTLALVEQALGPTAAAAAARSASTHATAAVPPRD
jgi:3-deoxy-D-manno-octulosonic-acid transferase